MVPAQPLSRKNFGTIPRRRRYLDGASNFGEGENPQQSESSTSPVIPLWMAGFLFAANQIFRASSFRSDSPSCRRIEQSTWTAPQCKPFIFDAARPHLQRRRRCRTSSYRPVLKLSN
jgi:hypothetical protein